MRVVLFIFLVVFYLPAYSQTFDWGKRIGGTFDQRVEDMVQDNAGNTYMIGYFRGSADFDPGPNTYTLTTGNNSGHESIFIMKLDANGNFVWANKIGGSTSEEFGKSIALDYTGNIVIAGEISGTVDFDPGVGVANSDAWEGDVFIARYRTDGSFIGVTNFGDDFFTNNYEYGLACDYSGIYITGRFNGTHDFDPSSATMNLTSNGGADIFVCKFNYSLGLVWAKNIGSTQDDKGVDLDLGTNGNVYITGGFSGTVDFDPGAGSTLLTSYGSSDAFVAKLDASGNFVWAKQISGTSYEVSDAITIGNNNEVYVGGWFSGTIDCDPNNATLYNLTSPSSTRNGFLTKLDANGNFMLARNIGGQYISDICVSNSNEVYIGGYFSNTVDFDPGTGVLNVSCPNWYDVFVTKLDASGNLAWTNQWSGTNRSGGNKGRAMVVKNNVVHLAGTFEGSIDLDAGPGVSYLASSGSEDIFLLKMTEILTHVDKAAAPSNMLKVAPNPTSSNILIQSKVALKRLALYNLQGQLLRTEVLNEVLQLDVSLGDLTNGVYLLCLEDVNGQQVQEKIIKQ